MQSECHRAVGEHVPMCVGEIFVSSDSSGVVPNPTRWHKGNWLSPLPGAAWLLDLGLGHQTREVQASQSGLVTLPSAGWHRPSTWTR